MSDIAFVDLRTKPQLWWERYHPAVLGILISGLSGNWYKSTMQITIDPVFIGATTFATFGYLVAMRLMRDDLVKKNPDFWDKFKVTRTATSLAKLDESGVSWLAASLFMAAPAITLFFTTWSETCFAFQNMWLTMILIALLRMRYMIACYARVIRLLSYGSTRKFPA